MLRARLARGNAAGPAGSATLVAAALPSPKKVRRVPDLAVQLRRTGLVVGAVLGAYLLGRLALGLWTLVAVFVGFAWAWDRFAPDLEDSPSRSGSLEDLHASSGDVQREPKQARTVDETGYSPGTSSIQTVTAPDGTVLTQITESVQWLNIAVARAWDVAQPLVSQIAQRAIDRALSTTLPPLVQSIKLDQFSLGATPPKIIAVSSFPDVVFCHEMKLPVLEVAVRLRWAPDDPPEFIFNRPPTPPDDDGRKGSSASSATKPGLGARSATAPPALNRSSVDSAASASTLMSDFSGESKSDDVHPLGQHSTIKLKVTTAGALPVTLTVGASKVSLDATIFLRLYPAQPFGPPWITRLQLRAFDPPETSLVLNPLGGSFDVFDVPYLRNWIRDGIDAGLGTLLCENGGIKIDFDQDGDPIVSLGLERPHFESSAGVLEFWIYEAKGLKNVDRLRFLGSKNDPFVRIMLGEKQLDQTEHRNNTLDPVFNHVTPILVPESVFTGGAKSEDHIKDFALNLHVCDMNDITKPARIGFLSLDLEDLCNGYLADRSLRLSGKPKDCWLPLTSRRTGEHRGTLRVGYRYFPAGDPLARGALIGAQLRSGILRVTIMSIDFAGAQFWQGHIRLVYLRISSRK